MASYRRTLPRITWGAGAVNQINFAYPLDEAIAYSKPQEGSAIAFLPSGAVDAWDAGTAYVLEAVVRWVPMENTATPLATGWDGATGWRAFLEWARKGNAFTFYPNVLTLGVLHTLYLEEPFDSAPTLEPDMTRAIRVKMRGTAAIDGY